MSGRHPLQSAAVTLLREAFEGREPDKDYTWFVERKEGIMDALATVDAQRASKKPSESCASIAAHAYHILFALQSANSYLGREKPLGNWESSWLKQTATPDEWSAVSTKIWEEYVFFRDWFAAKQDWTEADPETWIGALAQLPHMAFHLGAIRQIMKIV